MEIAPAHLEEWMRTYYFDVDIDIGSSGVESFSFADLRRLLNLDQDALDRIVFNDSRTMGGDGLRQAIAARWLNGDSNRVMVTHGSSEAIFLVMHALLSPGDEVITLSPSYQQLYAIAESIGCRIRFWPLKFEERFRPDLSVLQGMINSKTKMIIANFPNNPTGVTITAEEQFELIEMISSVGAYLVWDSAFADLIYDGYPLADPGHIYDRAISLGTLSKAYGLPGLRVGWCMGNREVLDRLVRLRDYITLHLSPLIEFVAERVIYNANTLLTIRLEQARKNLEVLSTWIDQQKDHIDWVPPQGGVCAFVRFLGMKNTEPFCHTLGKAYRVLLVPGMSFNQAQHARLGFGCSMTDLREGLSRLSGLLHSSQARPFTT